MAGAYCADARSDRAGYVVTVGDTLLFVIRTGKLSVYVSHAFLYEKQWANVESRSSKAEDKPCVQGNLCSTHLQKACFELERS